MSLKKFEDFEHNLEENDRKEHAADFKSAMQELFGKKIQAGKMYEMPIKYIIQKDDKNDIDNGIVYMNNGTGTPFVKVQILGFLEE